jgi:hypothetical protein
VLFEMISICGIFPALYGGKIEGRKATERKLTIYRVKGMERTAKSRSASMERCEGEV